MASEQGGVVSLSSITPGSASAAADEPGETPPASLVSESWEVCRLDARYVYDWLRQTNAPDNLVLLQERVLNWLMIEGRGGVSPSGKEQP